MAALLAQLPGPINLRLVLSDLKFADILHDLVTAKGNRSGVPRALAVDRNEPRELAGTLHLEAPGVPSYSYSYSANIIPTMTSATAPSGVALSVGSAGSGFEAWRAFNHQNVDYHGWYYVGATGWIQYQFPAAHIITRYAVTSMNNESSSHPPKSWTFKGSNNGTDWTTLDTQTNVTDWATSGNVRKVFDFTNATPYLYYRLDITAGNDAGEIAVGELEMMETMETVVSYSSGKDDAIAQIRAINALVTVGTTLTLQSTGATDAVTLKILPSRGVSQPIDELFELDGGPVLASCAFSFTCEPYAYGPETTVYENTGAVLPNVIDIDVPGDYPTPLQFSFDQISSGAVHAMYIGMLPDQSTPLLSLLRPASYAQYAGTCYVNAGNPATVGTSSPHGLSSGQTVEFWNDTAFPAINGIPYTCTVIDATHFSIPANVAYGGNATLTTFTSAPAPVTLQGDGYCYSGAHSEYSGSNAWASWEIDDRTLPPGTYRPLVRMKQAGAGVDSVYLSGEAGVNLTGPGFFSTNAIAAYSLDPMSATLHLPYHRMPEPGATWMTPRIWWGRSGGTPTLYMDYLALMPTSWGWAAWHDAFPAVGAANWVLGYDGIIYKNLVASTDGRSGGLTAVGAQRLFMVAAERHDAAHASAVTGRLIISAIPRYALWA